TQTRRLQRGEKLTHPLSILRIGRELPALRFFGQLKRALLPDVFDLQLFESRGDFGFTHARELVRSRACGIALCCFACRRDLTDREWLLRTGWERFDYVRYIH